MIHLAPTERVEMTLHKHWFILLERFVGLFFIYITPLVIWKVLETGAIPGIAVDPILFSRVHPAAVALVASGWSLIVWMKFFAFWIDHYLDTWILTNEKLIDVEQKSFFHREIATLRLAHIQDVSITTSGVFATLLGFGTIVVQTAAETPEFTMHGIAHPEHAKERILALIDRATRGSTTS